MAHSWRSIAVVTWFICLVPQLRAANPCASSPGGDVAVIPEGNGQGNGQVTVPLVSEEVSPVEELRISRTAYAAVRKPPGKGPFPAVIFLHGGLGNSRMERLRESSLMHVTPARFLAWGYVTVNATRRDIRHDPQDRGVVEDTAAIIEAVKQRRDVDPRSVVLYGGSGGRPAPAGV